MDPQKDIYIPERRCQDTDVETTYPWVRLLRQVYWLANGVRDMQKIAYLLSKPQQEIVEAVRTLFSAGQVTLRTETKPIILNASALKESFALIANKEEFSRRFYSRLFTDYPATCALFAGTDMTRQQGALMATLAAVVAGIDRGDNLTPVLHQLGEKHKRYGAQERHYPLVGAVLLETFQETLGKAFTCVMQDAWSEAFDVISGQMLETKE